MTLLIYLTRQFCAWTQMDFSSLSKYVIYIQNESDNWKSRKLVESLKTSLTNIDQFVWIPPRHHIVTHGLTPFLVLPFLTAKHLNVHFLANMFCATSKFSFLLFQLFCLLKFSVSLQQYHQKQIPSDSTNIKTTKCVFLSKYVCATLTF